MIRSLDDVNAFLSAGHDWAKDLSKLRESGDYTLENISRFLDLMGRPDESMTIFHVAGSKGKGTTSYILARLLEGRFGKCGLFVSPYVYDFRERFCRPDGFFSDEALIGCANELEALSQGHAGEFSRLSVFEKYVVFALLLFKREGMRHAVFEVGLGGRFDATNALRTDCQFITTIEKEHTTILGSTLVRIATEKSKIIKMGGICFALNNAKRVDNVFRSEAKKTGSRIFFLSDLARDRKSKLTQKGRHVTLVDWQGERISYCLPQGPSALAKDSALAVLSIKKLGLLDTEALERLETLRIPGRFERAAVNGVDYVLDGAHTRGSVRQVLDAFMALFPERKRILLFGCAVDKDAEGMARILAPAFHHVIVTKPGDYKRSDPKAVFDCFRRHMPSGAEAVRRDSALEAREELESAAKRGCAVLVTGSFFLVELARKSMMA